MTDPFRLELVDGETLAEVREEQRTALRPRGPGSVYGLRPYKERASPVIPRRRPLRGYAEILVMGPGLWFKAHFMQFRPDQLRNDTAPADRTAVVETIVPGGQVGRICGLLLIIALACFAALAAPALAQESPRPAVPPSLEKPAEAPTQVTVQPRIRDFDIRERLESILKATGWFADAKVRVQDGVVFLTGQTESDEFKKWAGNLARNTQDVTAVVNQIEVVEPSIWDFQPALFGLRVFWRTVLRALPFVAFALIILAAAWGAAKLATAISRVPLQRRLANPLLREVGARSIGAGVFVVGLYVVFEVVGLTNAAMTVMGGTGVLGLVLGIAFRDITENFLTSVFLSVQSPFRTGDLVEIAGIVGYVQRLTTRATILITLDGNHVQIPNAIVYKSNIHNYTSNPNRREDFIVGIGYQDVISDAQEVALKVLVQHPAVLNEPEPLVLVDSLGKATVNLRVYFWLDGSQHSWLKVTSSVIRLIKRAFQEAGISMPDEARELVFPDGVPVRLIEAGGKKEDARQPRRPYMLPAGEEAATKSTDAEAGLRSDAGVIQEQARQARTPEQGANLLPLPPAT